MSQTIFRCLLCVCSALAAAADKPAAEAEQKSPRAQRMASSGQRNENVAIWMIDNNAIKEANVRVGTNATAIAEATADTQHFATEHGRPPAETLLLQPVPAAPAWHGELFEWHQNSVFNARTFFQVGSVKPSHRNFYGGRLTGPAGRLGLLTANASQRHIRGMVNGNVLVPLADERAPLTTDPEKRAIVQRWLDAYPTDLPNRPDFDKRALNTNAAQSIDEVDGTVRLDTPLGWDARMGKLLSSYTVNRQRIDAFQLVAGQNPDTEIHSHKARLTWTRALDGNTVVTLGAGFARTRSVLLSEPNAVGPRVRMGFQIEELGPDNMFPVNRAANSFRYGGSVARMLAGGRHEVTGGGDLVRFQLNGIESGNVRGQFQFGNNFGRSAIENLRWGTPTGYEAAIGELARGYRNWAASGWAADKWKVHSRLQLVLGVRYGLETAPYEVQGRDTIPYGCDCNNVSPRVSLAWQAGRGWVARAMVTTSFSQILPVTYQQVRNNPPNVTYVQVPDPDLARPLQGIDLSDPNRRYTPTWLSKDLTSPYSHQYNATVEHAFLAGSTLRFGYIGSRTIKLLNVYIQNRAEPVDGIPLTTTTVDLRRPDPRYYDTRLIVNGGNALFDAGQVRWDLPAKRGLAAGMSYTFSKAIDSGVDFSATAANKDVMNSRSQWQYDSLNDRRGLSNFDAPHAWLANYSYDLPFGVQVSGVTMWKAGTPLTLYVGSDAPGFGNVDGGPSDRPNIVDPSILGMTIPNPDVAPQILRRERFDYIHPGERQGSLGRNAFRKASIWNWNAAVTKQWRIRASGERAAQIRLEAYNLTNTPQFDEPQRNLSSPSFGKITNTLNDGRVLQAGFRFLF